MVCKRSADYVLISVHGYVKINTIRGLFYTDGARDASGTVEK